MDVRKTTISIISFRPTGSGTWVNANSELSGVSSRGTKIPTLLLPVVELIRRLHRACLQARRVEETSPVHGMNAAAEGGPVPVSRTTRRAETSHSDDENLRAEDGFCPPHYFWNSFAGAAFATLMLILLIVVLVFLARHAT